jgi:hypothetical protein
MPYNLKTPLSIVVPEPVKENLKAFIGLVVLKYPEVKFCNIPVPV